MGTPHVMCMSTLPTAHEAGASHAAAEPRVTHGALHGSRQQSDEKHSARQSKSAKPVR